MSDAIRRIADAVLYEGYLLWPYRRSAPKNQQRWNFGCVMPPAWIEEHPDESSTIETQLLVEGDAAAVDVTVRFLQVVHRQLYNVDGMPVDAITIDGTTHLSWDEATEREVRGTGAFTIEAGCRREALPGGAATKHRWDAVHGTVALARDQVAAGLHRVTITVRNTTAGAPWRSNQQRDDTAGMLRTVALTHAFCSTHLILHVTDGAFVSPLDPIAGAECQQRRLWPVLVGEAPDRSTVLASEIMLEEYPRVAPESPGDLFDGGEVDQLLTLNILGMSDAEREEMRASDPRARAILERTEAMTADDLRRLHGTFRDRLPVGEG